MKLPTYEEFSSDENQMEVLEWPLNESVFVVGPPGSGKTVLAVRRAEMVSEWKKHVIVVTYNRMLRRLLYLLNKGSVRSQTMHSFVGQDYRQRTREQEVPTPPGDKYTFIWGDMFASLRKIENTSRFAHLVVDEGQDLPVGFFQYVAHFAAQTFTVFADEDQALMDNHTTLEEIKDAGELNDPIILRNNHRNTPEVANLAEHFHSGRLPAAEVSRDSIGELPRLIRSSGLAQTALFVSNWRKNRGGSIGVIVDQNDTGVSIYQQLKNLLRETRVDIYRNEDRNENDIDITKDGVTVLNKESVKGQEFDSVFILELERFIPFASDVGRRAMYMMCSRARDHLFLIYGPSDLSPSAAEALPNHTILERSDRDVFARNSS